MTSDRTNLPLFAMKCDTGAIIYAETGPDESTQVGTADTFEDGVMFAAAPVMLDALKWAEGSLKATGADKGVKDEDNEILCIIRAAIAKAEER